jgi:hypothetical protein
VVGAIAAAVMAGSVGGACSKSSSPPAKKPVAAITKPKLKLAVLAVESDKFPKVAEAATQSLAKVQLTGWAYGVDEVEVSKVSLEVVQLSIECVEQTPDCYQAVGKSLAANRLLFAQIVPDAPAAAAAAAGPKATHVRRPATKQRDIRVTVTMFDVDAQTPAKTAVKVFPSEQDATDGIDTLVAEATKR